LKSRIILLITAIIWGFAFVAQRKGMESVPPFTFNAVRFLIGCLSLLPIVLLNRKVARVTTNRKTIWLGGIAAGTVLFIASSLQQIGVVSTTAGKAGFITGLYVIIVPILGLTLRHRTGIWTWLGALAGVVGLFLLSVTEALTIEYGDLLVLIGALFWAIHVHIIAKFSSPIGALRLSLVQFAICAAASFVTAISFETIRVDGLLDGALPILYTGVLSVSVAYTLQIVGQRDTPPSQAVTILNLESVFAVLGGWLLLSETLPLRGVIGCAVIFVGMLVSQLDGKQLDADKRGRNFGGT
jgi:drug/metabolite transporter (DMT)-like permease